MTVPLVAITVAGTGAGGVMKVLIIVAMLLVAGVAVAMPSAPAQAWGGAGGELASSCAMIDQHTPRFSWTYKNVPDCPVDASGFSRAISPGAFTRAAAIHGHAARDDATLPPTPTQSGRRGRDSSDGQCRKTYAGEDSARRVERQNFQRAHTPVKSE